MVYDIPLQDIGGKSTSLKAYAGKPILIVNTASKCGYTPQYKDLQALYEKYKAKGLVVLGFPSNDFGQQEPGTDKEIVTFCEKNYGVTFPLYTKGPVSGGSKQPLFKYLTEEANAELKGEVKWNFEKFLIDRKGNLVSRYSSKVSPSDKSLQADVEKTL